MSWLNDLDKDIVFEYKNSSGEIIYGTKEELIEESKQALTFEAGDKMILNGVEYEYMGFQPITNYQLHKIEFEQNGRIGVKTINAKGSSYVSKTRLNYEKSGTIQRGLAKGFKD